MGTCESGIHEINEKKKSPINGNSNNVVVDSYKNDNIKTIEFNAEKDNQKDKITKEKRLSLQCKLFIVINLNLIHLIYFNLN